MLTQKGVFIADNQGMTCLSCKKNRPVSDMLEIVSGWYCPGECLLEGLEESVMELSKPPKWCLVCHLIMDDELKAEKNRVKNIACVDCTKERISGHIRCQEHYLQNRAITRDMPHAKGSRRSGGGKYAS